MNVTVFKSKNNATDCTYSTVTAVLKRFREPNKLIDQVRNEKDPKKQEELKGSLPAVVFQGKFSRRKNSALIQSSGFMILDFDCKSGDESKAVYEKIKDDPHFYAIFRSVRGVGYKALVRIPAVNSDAEYKQYFYSMKDRYPELDDSGKDISRLCFITSDPEMKMNTSSKVWDTKKEKQKLSAPPETGTDYTKLNQAANVIRSAQEGQRHEKIRNASILAGGWVASGIVDRLQAERILIDEANRKNPDEPKVNEQAVRDGIDFGMSKPLTDEQGDRIIQESEHVEKFGKIYYAIEDVSDSIDKRWENGIGQGYTCGLPVIDDLYKMYLGFFTTLYGPAFSGKSQLWHHYLYYLSRRYGMRHAIFSPETGDRVDIFAELMEIHAQADFNDSGYGKMSIEAREDAKRFIGQHFVVIDPEEKDMDFSAMVGTCEMIERYYNTKLHTVTVDPWNDLDHDMSDDNFRDDTYLQRQLKRVRIKARANNWHICLVTHSRDQALAKLPGGGGMYYPPATFREVAGGQAWSRRGFQMVSVWRPHKDMTEYKDRNLHGDEVYWIQQKFKPKYAGKIGEAVLRYDVKEKRYFEDGTWKTYPRLDLSQPENQPTQESGDCPF